MAADAEEETLIEEREEEMVAFLGSNQPIKRKGWFLKPTSNSIKSSLFSPFYSPSSAGYKISTTPKCSFKGWVCSLRFWDQWVEKLRPKYKDLWKKVGIFEAINASTYKFKRDPSSLWGIARFWCEETNTFLFPWAEATVTLEDVMILGGFSVLGEPVRVAGPLDCELGELESEMVREVRKFNQTKSKKADISTWMKHYREEGNGNELEHIAFLAMWLSRFVLLAHPARTIGLHVIPVAVRLARGVRIALAPAVLASLYRDMRKMKDYLATYRKPNTPPLIVWAPFHILQLWVWERFLALRPEASTFVNSDEPRAARWHGMGKKLAYPFVTSVIKSPDEIQWRPYLSLDNWCKPSYFRDDGEWICTHKAADEGIESFARCLRASELVGLDCIEQYHPHRVARQFGLDQDIPPFVPRATSTWEVAWGTFDISAKNVNLYVPSRLFESDVTIEYSVWWDSVQKLLKKNMKGKKRKKTQTLQCCYKKESQEGDDVTISDWLDNKNQCISSKRRCENPPKHSTNVTAIQDHHVCMENTNICGELKLSLESTLSDWLAQKNRCINSRCINSKHSCENPHEHSTNVTAVQDRHVYMKNTEIYGKLNLSLESTLSDWLGQKNQCHSLKHRCETIPEHSTNVTANQDHHACMKNTEINGERKLSLESPETMEEDADALSNVKVENEAVTSNQLEIKDKEVVGYIKETSAGESEKLEENFKMEEVEENTADNRSMTELAIEENFKREELEENFKMEEGEESTADNRSGAELAIEENFKREELEENFKMEEVEESTADKRSGTELAIEKLKEEIALIHARVKNLESLAETSSLTVKKVHGTSTSFFSMKILCAAIQSQLKKILQC